MGRLTRRNAGAGSSDVRKTLLTKGIGGKDNRKENRQGCLSGRIKQIPKLLNVLEFALACQKGPRGLFDKLGRLTRRNAGAGGFFVEPFKI